MEGVAVHNKLVQNWKREEKVYGHYTKNKLKNTTKIRGRV